MSAPVPETWTRGLNAEQAAAVMSDPDGAALILAGAGSGKTTVLTRRAAYLSDPRFQGQGILALTFTKDAALEMETRLRDSGANAGCPVMPWIGTFHAFAFGLLRSGCAGVPNWERLGFAKCPGLLDPVEKTAWLRANSAAGECLDTLEAWLARPFSDDTNDTVAEKGREGPGAERAGWRSRFRGHLLAIGALSFDDMVALVLRLLEKHPEVLAECRARYPRILVDEFQDTSRDQLELVRLLAGERPRLFLVGDDDQAIYGFRGADPGNIPAALARFPSMRVFKLEINYRSSAPIVAYANTVFRAKPAALRKRLRAGSARGSAPVRTVVHRDGAEQARWMVAEMERLRREAGLAWGDMAVLFRLNALEPYYRAMLDRLAGPAAAREVALATVHAAKGLEYPAVFFAGLEDGILPYRRGSGPLAPERMEEERRIFYVGVTRAQRFLYLCASRRRILRGKAVAADPSPFLGRGGSPAGIQLPTAMARALRIWRRKAAAA
jgi:superfamily I DNA/RNA helicase